MKKLLIIAVLCLVYSCVSMEKAEQSAAIQGRSGDVRWIDRVDWSAVGGVLTDAASVPMPALKP